MCHVFVVVACGRVASVLICGDEVNNLPHGKKVRMNKRKYRAMDHHFDDTIFFFFIVGTFGEETEMVVII